MGRLNAGMREAASLAVLGLGSNVGDRRCWLQRAVQDLSSNELEILQASSLYLTEPVDYPDQAWFLNQALVVRTRLEPHRLLVRCLEVEEALGRQPSPAEGPPGDGRRHPALRRSGDQ